MDQKTLEQITINITKKCPAQCLHCSASSSPKRKEELSFSKVKEIIEEGIKFGVTKVVICGGEPFNCSYFLDLVKFLRKSKLKIIIYTSGIFLSNDGKIQTVPNEIMREIQYDVYRFHLSLHSIECEENDFFMGVRNSNVLSNHFLAYVVQFGIPTHIHTVVTKLNIKNLVKLAQFLYDKGIRTQRFLKLIPQGRCIKNRFILDLDKDDVALFEKKYYEIVNKFKEMKFSLGAHMNSDFNTEYACSLDKKKITIDTNGDILVCPAFLGLKSVIKPLNIHNISLDNILNSSWRRNVSLLKEKFDSKCPAVELYEGSA